MPKDFAEITRSHSASLKTLPTDALVVFEQMSVAKPPSRPEPLAVADQRSGASASIASTSLGSSHGTSTG
jgi:hypothetical protein